MWQEIRALKYHLDWLFKFSCSMYCQRKCQDAFRFFFFWVLEQGGEAHREDKDMSNWLEKKKKEKNIFITSKDYQLHDIKRSSWTPIHMQLVVRSQSTVAIFSSRKVIFDWIYSLQYNEITVESLWSHQIEKKYFTTNAWMSSPIPWDIAML